MRRRRCRMSHSCRSHHTRRHIHHLRTRYLRRRAHTHRRDPQGCMSHLRRRCHSSRHIHCHRTPCLRIGACSRRCHRACRPCWPPCRFRRILQIHHRRRPCPSSLGCMCRGLRRCIAHSEHRHHMCPRIHRRRMLYQRNQERMVLLHLPRLRLRRWRFVCLLRCLASDRHRRCALCYQRPRFRLGSRSLRWGSPRGCRQRCHRYRMRRRALPVRGSQSP